MSKMEEDPGKLKKKKKIFLCQKCNQTFASMWSLKRHIEKQHKPLHCAECQVLMPSRAALTIHKKKFHSVYKCDKCPELKGFNRKSSLKRHVELLHEGIFPTTTCTICHENLESVEEADRHFQENHQQSEEWTMYDHALKKSVQNWRRMLRMQNGIEALLSEEHLQQIVKFLKVHRAEHPHFKISMCAIVVWAASATENFSALKQVPIRTYSKNVMIGTNLRQIAISLIQELMDRIEKFEHNGSGYILQEVMSLDLEIFNFSELYSGCAINIKKMKNKKHLLSVDNKDDFCLLYSVAAYFQHSRFSKERQTDPKSYLKWINTNIDVTGMEFPSGIKDVKTLVKQNPHLDLNVSLFLRNNRGVFPMASNIKNENQKGRNKINLLRISHKTGDTVNNGHFVLIRDLDSFLQKKTCTEKRSQVYKKKFCNQCFSQFKSVDSPKYKNHQKLCTNKYNQKEIMPDKEDRVEFKNFDKQYQTDVMLVISISIFSQ